MSVDYSVLFRAQNPMSGLGQAITQGFAARDRREQMESMDAYRQGMLELQQQQGARLQERHQFELEDLRSKREAAQAQADQLAQQAQMQESVRQTTPSFFMALNAVKSGSDKAKLNKVNDAIQEASQAGNMQLAQSLSMVKKAYENGNTGMADLEMKRLGRNLTPDHANNLFSKEAADIEKTFSEAYEIQEKGEAQDIANRQSVETAEDLDEDVRAIYRDADENHATANEDLLKMSNIMSNAMGVSPDEFGGGMVDAWKRFAQTKLSGREWGKDGDKRAILRSQLAGLRLSEAMKQKASGALTEGEMNELLKTTPAEDADISVYKKWIGARIKAIEAVRAKEYIAKQFILKNRTDMPAEKKFKIQIGDKVVTVNKGQNATDVISMLGTKVHEYAPEFKQFKEEDVDVVGGDSRLNAQKITRGGGVSGGRRIGRAGVGANKRPVQVTPQSLNISEEAFNNNLQFLLNQ